MIHVARAKFLQVLESVTPGLTPKEQIVQSSCVCFQDGKVFTFNDEVACVTNSGLPLDFEGAAQARPLITILQQMPDEDLMLEPKDGTLTVYGKGKKRRLKAKLEPKVLLPIQSIQPPGDWTKLPSDFSEAVRMVQECCGNDHSQIHYVCVHIHPGWVEAFDSNQYGRFTIKTGFEEPFLVKKDAIKHVTAMDLTEFSEVENWVHFQGPSGLVLSCRRWMFEEVVDTSSQLQVPDARPAIFPKSLAESAKIAEVCSSEMGEVNYISVRLQKDTLMISGQGVNVNYDEIKGCDYKGPPIHFLISPKILSKMLEKESKCEIGSTRIKVTSQNWTWLARLRAPERNGQQ